jgi:hypothetical protein
MRQANLRERPLPASGCQSAHGPANNPEFASPWHCASAIGVEFVEVRGGAAKTQEMAWIAARGERRLARCNDSPPYSRGTEQQHKKKTLHPNMWRFDANVDCHGVLDALAFTLVLLG